MGLHLYATPNLADGPLKEVVDCRVELALGVAGDVNCTLVVESSLDACRGLYAHTAHQPAPGVLSASRGLEIAATGKPNWRPAAAGRCGPVGCGSASQWA